MSPEDRLREAREGLADGTLRARIGRYGTQAMKALLASWDDWDGYASEHVAERDD